MNDSFALVYLLLKPDFNLIILSLIIIYIILKYAFLNFKYLKVKPGNEYDRRIFYQSKKEAKKYSPILLIVIIYFVFNYYPKSFSSLLKLEKDSIKLTSVYLGSSESENFNEEDFFSDSNKSLQILNLLNSAKYKKALFERDMSGTSFLELTFNETDDIKNNIYVSIRDGRYIGVSKINFLNLASNKYYIIKSSKNLSDEIFKILE